MFKKDAELSAAKQLGLPDSYTIVYASIVINHVTDSAEMGAAVIHAVDSYRKNYPEEEDEWLIHEAEQCIDKQSSRCDLPKGWFLVEMAEPEGDGYRPGKFGLVNLSEFYGDSDE